MDLFAKLIGTIRTTFYVGFDGPQIKAPSFGRLQTKNNTDTALVPHDVGDADLVDAATTRRQLISQVLSGGPTSGYASGAFREILPSGDPFPTSVIWWTSAAKTAKIVEVTITYGAGQIITQEVYKVYEDNGTTVLTGNTFTDTLVNSGPFEVSRTRVAT